ncbi:MAG: dihydrolipoyl dehydrogenase [Gammaproteobacteria bacterium]|nr:dihydrolipoyl dehydrogenase [Gammaproteobacteria bacterium]
MSNYDVVIIGAGPGGYVAAVRASQLGLSVAVVEKDNPGGVCLNWGCIPSKNLIHQAEVFHSLREMEAVGVTVDRSSLDYAAVQAKSREVVKTLTGGVAGLLKKNKVTLLNGSAKVTGKGEVSVTGKDGVEKLQAKNILVATGSSPMQVPGFECDEEQVLSSNGVLAITELPESIIILGAGAIGCEFAYVLNSFGVEVTLVEALDHILPTEDFEACAVLEKCFLRDGIAVKAKTRAGELKRSKDSVTVTLQNTTGESEELTAEKVLVVFGRVPNTADLGLAEMGVKLDDRGYVGIGDYCQTAAAGIYAIGDITRTPALAHVASTEGEIAVEHMAGHTPAYTAVDPDIVPSAVYCEPQVAGFGLREDQAKAEGISVKKSVFHYVGAGKTIAVGKPDGLVKILCDEKTDEILGAHIVGHNATELLHELLLGKNAELLPEDIGGMMHAHPTIGEAIMEAAKGINGQPVHG